ncbi:MAG: hypothetical protein R3Y40_00750 [Eubacteriales bacterium]
MSSKTKIIVLHMKEIVYTCIFLVLGILLVCLLFFMFHSNETVSTSNTNYQPGIYTSTITLSNATLEVEVLVDDTQIQSISFSNLDEAISTSYPLIQPAMEDIATQICETQSLENISYSDDTQYTSQVIINAIEVALEKAYID